MEIWGLDRGEGSAMWIDYEQAIAESAADLLTIERQQRGSAVADRGKMLRLLKTNAYPSQRQGATVLGYPERQLRRWWSVYAQGGLEALLRRERRGGRLERREAAGLAVLEAQMKAGRIARLGDAHAFWPSNGGCTSRVSAA